MAASRAGRHAPRRQALGVVGLGAVASGATALVLGLGAVQLVGPSLLTAPFTSGGGDGTVVVDTAPPGPAGTPRTANRRVDGARSLGPSSSNGPTGGGEGRFAGTTPAAAPLAPAPEPDGGLDAASGDTTPVALLPAPGVTPSPVPAPEPSAPEPSTPQPSAPKPPTGPGGGGKPIAEDPELGEPAPAPKKPSGGSDPRDKDPAAIDGPDNEPKPSKPSKPKAPAKAAADGEGKAKAQAKAKAKFNVKGVAKAKARAKAAARNAAKPAPKAKKAK